MPCGVRCSAFSRVLLRASNLIQRLPALVLLPRGSLQPQREEDRNLYTPLLSTDLGLCLFCNSPPGSRQRGLQPVHLRHAAAGLRLLRAPRLCVGGHGEMGRGLHVCCGRTPVQCGLAGAAACTLIDSLPSGAYLALRLLQHLWPVPLNLTPLVLPFCRMWTTRPPAASLWRAPTTGQVRLCSGGQLLAAVPLTCSSAGRPRSLPVCGCGADSRERLLQPGAGGSKVAQSLSQCTRSAHLLIQRRPLARRVPHQAHAARLCCALLGRRHLRLLRWGCRAHGWLGHGLSQSAVVWGVSEFGADQKDGGPKRWRETCDLGGNSTHSSAGSLDDASKCMLPCRL